MSFYKSDGSRIEIRFTEPILPLTSLGSAYRTLNDATITAQNYYSSSYLPALMNDGVANTSSYWYGTTAVNWIKIGFRTSQIAHGFRWYKANSTYRPSTFTVSGSNDDVNWTVLSDILTTQSSSTGWEAFTFTNTDSYLHYRINILTSNSSIIYISEVELLLEYGNEKAFTITVPEYKYVPEGPIENSVKPVRFLENKVGFLHSVDFSEMELTNLSMDLSILKLKDISSPKEFGILTEPSDYTITTNKYEMGWIFTVGSQDIYVSGLRVKYPAGQSTTANLWTSGGTKLASVDINAVAGQWVEGAFISGTVVLSAGVSYVISCYNTSSRYYSSKTNFTYNPKLTSGGGRYIANKNNFPTSTEPATIYPMIDIVLGKTEHASHGSGIYHLENINVTNNTESLITWKDIIPIGTSLSVSVSTDGVNYTAVSSGEPILSTGIAVDDLYLKIEMSTINSEISPEISDIVLLIKSTDDAYILTLHIQDNRRFNSAVGNISVEYDNEIGTLTGVGGPVDSFSLSFAPTDLIAKPHQMTTEHIEISNITAVGVLTNINDI